MFEHAGRVRLHRRGAPSWDAAECTLVPGLDLPVASSRCLLPSAFSGSAYAVAPASRLSITQHFSMRLLPNQAPEPTRSLALSIRRICFRSQINRRVAHL